LSLYIRGDYYVCPNPLSLDTYNICEHNCVFCFTKEMEQTLLKKRAAQGLKPLDLKKLDKQLPKFLDLKLPIIIGRKCEAFCYSERRYRNTQKALGILKDYDAKVVVETKGFFLKEHFDLLIDLNAGINISVTPGSDNLAMKLEPGLPLYSDRFEYAEEFKSIGLWVGIKAEPIIPGVNTSPEDLDKFVERCAELKPDHVNIGDYRVHNLKIAMERWRKAGYDLLFIATYKDEYWEPTGNWLFKQLKKAGLRVTSPDWVTFWQQNDCISCCGFDGTFNYHKFNFQYAVYLIKQKGRVKFSDVAKHNIFGEKYVEKFKKIWNTPYGRYYTPADIPGIEVIGYDGEGNKIYGKPKTLKEVFGCKS